MAESRQRQLLHTRQVVCRGFKLPDGLWEVEGRMIDLKNFPMASAYQGGTIAVGDPLHDMALTLTFDRRLIVRSIRATIDAAPFHTCQSVTGAFSALEGLSLNSGFTRQARERLGGVKGCTHLLELLGPIATTAHQTLWQGKGGYVPTDPKVVDLLLDSCYSLARDGVVVRKFNEGQEQPFPVRT